MIRASKPKPQPLTVRRFELRNRKPFNATKKLGVFMAQIHKIIVPNEADGERLDIYLSKHPKIPSRSYAQKLISQSLVKVDGKPAHKHHKVKTGELIMIEVPPPVEPTLIPETIPLKIVYEDDDIIVVSKPAGMVSHPSFGHNKGTLVHALLGHCSKLSHLGGKTRPGIVHRLDKDTSGLIIAAKNNSSHLSLAEQIKEKELKRTYLALVQGRVEPDQGVIEAPIGRGSVNRKKMVVGGKAGREAITYFEVLERLGDYTLLKVDLSTGRTHQIRVHLSWMRHPVVGDPQYGG